jgi:hypothetical protein
MGRGAGERASASDTESKAKHGRFCASFADYFSLDWLYKAFQPQSKNESPVDVQAKHHESEVGVVMPSNAYSTDAADDMFFRVESSAIRHSLSLGESTVCPPLLHQSPRPFSVRPVTLLVPLTG